MRVRLWVLALLPCLATAGVASAQVQSGNISGTVKDDQGGVLPGVMVTLPAVGRRRRSPPRPTDSTASSTCLPAPTR